MEAHTVKHPAFHHLHQANPPTNHLANHLSHNSLSASINTSSTSQPFAFGSSQSQGSSQQGSSASKLNFESSTAFPLLLSSISSESGLSGVGGVGSSVGGAGRSNAFSTPKAGVSFSRGSTSKGSSTFGSLSTGLHNAATAGNLSNHSASSQLSLAQQFTSAQLGAGKHKHASTATAGPPVDHQQFALSSNSNISSHPLTNGIAKGTPRPKASAPPNQLATFGPATPNGRGHLHQQLHLHGAKSTPGQQYLTDGGATVGATSALPFKKNLLAPKSATTSSSSGASKKVNKGSATKADKSSGLLNKTKNNNSSPSSEVTKSRKQSVSTLSTVSNLSENRATLFPNDGAQMVIGEQPHLDTPVSERIVFFSESIIDGFAIQCFTDQESLELSLQDAVKHDLTVLHNFAINSSSTTATSTTTTATTSPSTARLRMRWLELSSSSLCLSLCSWHGTIGGECHCLLSHHHDHSLRHVTSVVEQADAVRLDSIFTARQSVGRLLSVCSHRFP
ncbi:hypothetical protein TYRP_020885 [Tyrophagus putrescentiae]|nr:hypothetical protein TYRP_020885 [Tyrophagus putrescentiae]